MSKGKNFSEQWLGGLSKREHRMIALLVSLIFLALVSTRLDSTSSAAELQARVFKIPVRKSIELSGKSKQAICELRREAAKDLPMADRLWPPSEKISDSLVWKDIASGAHWVENDEVYTPEPGSNQMLNQGFFVNNPGILVGPQLKRKSGMEFATDAAFIVCEEVVFFEAHRKIKMTYSVSKPEIVLSLNLINATDAGFRHFAFAPKLCQGVRFLEEESCEPFISCYKALPIDSGPLSANQLCQLGQGTPHVRITSLPAMLTGYLWRDPAEGPGAAIDNLHTSTTVVIQLNEPPTAIL